jgi:uncharacterized membrane protein
MTRLRNLGERLWTTFWFLPSLMTLAAVALSFGVIAVDNRVQSKALGEFSPYWWLYTGGAEGARTLLSAVAGSMMTVVGVAFSITIVSLQLASSQFGPRLLRNFMRDTGNQIVLGTFVATFMYCLLVLRTVRGEDGIGDTFVPHVAVTVGVLLAACSVAVLIYFIHHSAAAIQADNVVATVSADLAATIDRLFPEPVGRPAGAPTNAGLPEDFDAQAVPVPAPRTGYLQTVDPDELMRVAKHHDLVFRLSVRPGQFRARRHTGRARLASIASDRAGPACRGAGVHDRHPAYAVTGRRVRYLAARRDRRPRPVPGHQRSSYRPRLRRSPCGRPRQNRTAAIAREPAL